MDKRLDLVFTKYVNDGLNPDDAIRKLDHKIFVENWEGFNTLPDKQQWQIRNYIDALYKIYGK